MDRRETRKPTGTHKPPLRHPADMTEPWLPHFSLPHGASLHPHRELPTVSPRMTPMIPAAIFLGAMDNLAPLPDAHPDGHTPRAPKAVSHFADTHTPAGAAAGGAEGGAKNYAYPPGVMFGAMVSSAFWLYSNQFSPLAFLPSMLIDERGVSESVTGLMLSFYPIAAFFTATACSDIVTKRGPEVAQVAALGFTALSALLFAFANELWMFFSLRLAQGFFNALFTQGMYVFVARIYPNEAPYRIGLLETAIGLGCMTGQVVGGFAYSHFGFSAPFLLQGALLAVSALLCHVTMRRRPVVCDVCALSSNGRQLGEALLDTAGSPGQTLMCSCGSIDGACSSGASDCEEGGEVKYKHLLARPRVAAVALIALCTGTSYTFFDPILAPRLQAFLGPLSETTVGAIMSCSSLLYMPAAVIAGSFCSHDRRSSPNLTETAGSAGRVYVQFIFWGLLLCCLGYQVLGPSPLLVALLPGGLRLDHTTFGWSLQIGGQSVSAVGNALAFVPLVPLMQEELADLPSHAKDMGLAVVMAAIALGEALAPLASGALVQFSDFPTAACFFSLFYLTCALVVALVFSNTTAPVAKAGREVSEAAGRTTSLQGDASGQRGEMP